MERNGNWWERWSEDVQWRTLITQRDIIANLQRRLANLEHQLRSVAPSVLRNKILSGNLAPIAFGSSIAVASEQSLLAEPMLQPRTAPSPPLPHPPNQILSGFVVRIEGRKVIVEKGEYRKGGERKEFGGAEIPLPSPSPFPYCIVAFDFQEETVKLVTFCIPTVQVPLRVILP